MGTLEVVVPGVPPAVHPAAFSQTCGGNVIGIDADELVISVRSDIGQAQHRVGSHFLLDSEIPFLNGRRLRVSLKSLRREGACRRG